MKTHLLIDGDVIAFTAASAAQEALIDKFGIARPFAHTKVGEAIVENMLANLKHGLGADSFEVVLSDPKDNWRKQIDPTYKTNRVGERPMLLDYLKDYLRQKHDAIHWAGLEADDVLGVMMTDPERDEKRCVKATDRCEGSEPCPYCESKSVTICVGRDKDFKSIPGFHHMLRDNDLAGKPIVREVTQWEADRFHMIQTLAGDAVDGYAGCSGIGMKRAAEIIDNPVRLVPEQGVKTRGVNKGEGVTRWMAEPTRDYWVAIVSQYLKAGMTEADALKTARLARILRHGEYDPSTEELILWTPSMLPRR